VVGRSLPVTAAIDAPRLHAEGETLHLEGGWPLDATSALEERWDVVRWGARNLYFGGVQAVELGANGAIAAAGDPRRGGAGMVVA
jgi:gamma-glutamyltranspeptidase/glutathione hydrolase